MGDIGVLVNTKLQKVMEKNSMLHDLRSIRSIFLNKSPMNDLEYNFSSSETSNMKHTPITSVDVERSFSRYKSVLKSHIQLCTCND